MQWLRNSFIAGLVVTVPLVLTLAAFAWVFGLVDGLVGPVFARALGREIPGLGILTTALAILLVGTVATNVIGRRLFLRAEGYLLRVPVFGTVYAPIKQLVGAFSPDNEFGFKRVVVIEDLSRGYLLGFLTKEFTIDRGRGPEPMLAVYVPTNHLYLGDLLICPQERAYFPDISVEQAVRLVLTGGMAFPPRVRSHAASDRVPEFRV
jgi:uncharacterized membrane protein